MKRRVELGIIAVIFASGWLFLFMSFVQSLRYLLWTPLDTGFNFLGTGVLSVLTELGSEYFILAAASLVYLLYDRQLGKKLFLLFLVSGWFNILAKGVFTLARPPDPKVRFSGEYTFPSGHTQLTASFWSYLALHFNRWPWFFAFLACALFIGFTRMALMAHFFADVLGGLFLGTFIALAFFIFQRGVSTNRVLEQSNVRAFMVMVLPFLAIALLSVVLETVPKQAYELSGLAIGFGIGDTLLRGKKLNRPKNWLDRTGILVILVVILFPFLVLLSTIPESSRWASLVVTMCGGFAISGITPFVFSKVKQFSGLAL